MAGTKSTQGTPAPICEMCRGRRYCRSLGGRAFRIECPGVVQRLRPPYPARYGCMRALRIASLHKIRIELGTVSLDVA